MNVYDELSKTTGQILLYIKSPGYASGNRIRLLGDADKQCRYMFGDSGDQYLDHLASKSCFVPDMCRDRSDVIRRMKEYDLLCNLHIVKVEKL